MSQKCDELFLRSSDFGNIPFSLPPEAIVFPLGLGTARRFLNRIDLWAGSVLPLTKGTGRGGGRGSTLVSLRSPFVASEKVNSFNIPKNEVHHRSGSRIQGLRLRWFLCRSKGLRHNRQPQTSDG